jgi:hypothetical protein
MSTYLVDNFEIGVSKPIDNRFVVGPGLFYTDKDSINNKYVGLRVWDVALNQSFIWNGTSWLSETLSGTSIIGNGTPNRVPLFTGTYSITSSNISQLDFKVGINNDDPQYELDVNGRIYCSNGFIGNGSGITSINASNISSGNLPLERLSGGGNNNVLVGSSASAYWASLSTLPGSMPIGAIIMWSGQLSNIPAGWGICDGTNYGSVISPDLRQKFIFGSGIDNNVVYPNSQSVGEVGNLTVGQNDENIITFYSLAFIIYFGIID